MAILGKLIAKFAGVEREEEHFLTFSIKDKRSANIFMQELHSYQSRGKEDLLLTIETYSPTRSKEQNKLMWALLDLMGKNINGGMLGCAEECYFDMLEKFGSKSIMFTVENKPEEIELFKEKFRATRVLETNQYLDVNGEYVDMAVLKCFYGSSKMTMSEMYAFTEMIINHMEEMGIDTTYMPEYDYLVSEYKKSRGIK